MPFSVLGAGAVSERLVASKAESSGTHNSFVARFRAELREVLGQGDGFGNDTGREGATVEKVGDDLSGAV